MIFSRAFKSSARPALLSFFAILILTGCATQRVDWNARIGNYTFDDAVMEYGPPDKDATLSDGTRVAEWLAYRGMRHGTVTTLDSPLFYGPGYYPYRYRSPIVHYHETASPDSFLRLTFSPDGGLMDWRRFSR